MKTIKNITSALYFFTIFFSIVLGSMMEYFGNDYGKYIMLPGILFAIVETIKNDK